MSAAGQPLYPGGHPGAAPASPGSVYPIRRMQLNDVFGAGFRMLRHSPKTMLGIPLAAALLSYLLGLLILLVPGGDGMTRMFLDPMAMEDPELVMDTFAAGEFIIVSLLTAVLGQALILIAGAAVALPTLRAAYGFRTGFGQALSLRARRFLPLLVHYVVISVLGIITLFIVIMALALFFGFVAADTPALGVIVGLLALPVLLFAMLWVTTALLYAPVTIMVEDKGPIAAIGRSFRLNRGMWWPNMGTVLLLGLMLIALAMIISVPSMLLMGLGGAFAFGAEDPASGSTTSLVVFAVSSLLDSVMTALMIALWGGIVATMYLNCRFRQEAADVALLGAAPHSPDDGRIIPASVEHLGRLQPAAGQPGPHAPNPYQQGSHHQNPYGHNPYGQNPYGQNPYGQNPYGQSPYGQPPQDQPPYGQNPYGQPPQAQPPYGRPDDDADGRHDGGHHNGGHDDFGRPR